MREKLRVDDDMMQHAALAGAQATRLDKRRAWGGALLAAALLVLLLAGMGQITQAAAIAPANGPAPAPQAPRTGQPIMGPAAALSVVNLQALPPAPAIAGRQVLPFHRVGGARPAAPALILPRLVPGLAQASISAPVLVTGFNGINIIDSAGPGNSCFCVPPDGDMAAGPNHVIVGVNQAFRVYNKTGQPLTAPISYDAFFTGCGPTGLTSSDPVTAYDPVANRFTVGILRYASSNGPSFMSLAVSQSADPTTTYNRYCFEQPYMGLMALYDFPHISVGQDAIFTTGNVFPPGSEQNISARVNAYNKAMMYSGAMTATQIYSDVLQNSDSTIADTIRPVLFNTGVPTATNYFVNVSSTAPSSRVTLWRWILPFSTNSFVQGGGVDVALFAPAVSMLQPPPGQPMPPPGFIDTRTLGGMWANNTVYATHTIGCNPGTGVTDCIQWYQLGSIDGTPTVLQQGIVSGTNESRAYPDLAVDQYGNVELAYAFSSLTDFIGIRHTGRLASDPPGAMGPETTIKAGEMAELGFDAARYGDYSGSVLDPDGVTLWHFEEYTQNIPDPTGATGSWGTWTSASRFPPPNTPTPVPTQTPGGPTATSTPPPSATPSRTATATQPPSPTPGGPTVTPTPTNLPTAAPTNTPGGPTPTRQPAPTSTATRTRTALATPPPPTGTAATGTATPVPPSATLAPTQTPGGPTATPAPGSPTGTAVPPTASATPCALSFSDVQPADYFYTPVLYLACHGVISGYADGTFRPYNDTTRSQMVKIVVLGFQKPIATPAGGNYTFTDVPPANPFFGYIETAAALNIVSGYNCGGPGEPCDSLNRPYFRPFASVTRGQLSKIDAAAAGWALLNPATATFTDVPPGSAFYTFVETAVCHGVVSGYADQTFRPFNNATRGQISKIVYLSITGAAACTGDAP